METDDTTAAFDERFERALLAIAHVAVVSLIDHQHVNALKFGSAGVMQRAVDDGPVLGEDLAPVSEKLWIVVLAWPWVFSPAWRYTCIPLGFWPGWPGCALLSGCISRLSGLR